MLERCAGRRSRRSLRALGPQYPGVVEDRYGAALRSGPVASSLPGIGGQAHGDAPHVARLSYGPGSRSFRYKTSPERQEGLSTPLRLRPQQLEMRALQLVDLVLAGRRIEDDLVECKGQWPDPQKRSSARQLAGHANKARDEPILWIIGLDEKAHTLTSPASIEVADWWASISSCFDPPALELEHHLVVPVDEHQAVTALRFLTDRSPYVIKGGGQDGTLHREVPIRDGTGTRSARRDELLRLLLPAVGAPSAQLLSANLRASHYPEIEGQTTSRTSVYLTATVFFE